MANERDQERRSNCPISAALEVLGDRWSLLIVRDMMFGGARSYKELMSSAEGIASNILASRLTTLEAQGILTGVRDPSDGRRFIYRLTAKGVELAPVLLELSRWGTRFEAGQPPAGLLEAWQREPDALLAGLRRKLLQAEPSET